MKYRPSGGEVSEGAGLLACRPRVGMSTCLITGRQGIAKQLCYISEFNKKEWAR